MNAPDDYTIAAMASMEAERALVGGLMLNNGLWDLVGDLLIEDDFFSEQNKKIYRAISQLINATKPADIVTVHDMLGGEVELSTLNALAQFVPSANNARKYAEIVRERALSRKLLGAVSDIQELAHNHTIAFDVRLEQASAAVSNLLDRAAPDDWQGTDEGVLQALDRISEQADGSAPPDYVPFGLKELDDALDGGGREGELIIIGARPSMGKSALALTIGMHVALNEGKPVGLFSMEMPKPQVTNRQISLVSHIHLSKLKRPERMSEYDWSCLTPAVEKLRQISFYTSDKTGLNINQMRTRARGLKRRHGLRVLIVDYLGLMSGTDPKAPRAYQLEEATKGLKNLAKELGITVILLAQINREAEKRVDQMPILSDLRDSGAIEQDADIVIFIHRPIRVKPDLGDEWKNYAKAFIAKQRDGGTAYLDLGYAGENTRFYNWEGDLPTTVGSSAPSRKPL